MAGDIPPISKRTEERDGFLLDGQLAVQLGEHLELLARGVLAAGLEQRLGEVEPDLIGLRRHLGRAAEELQSSLALAIFDEDAAERIHDLRVLRRELIRS